MIELFHALDNVSKILYGHLSGRCLCGHLRPLLQFILRPVYHVDLVEDLIKGDTRVELVEGMRLGVDVEGGYPFKQGVLNGVILVN